MSFVPTEEDQVKSELLLFCTALQRSENRPKHFCDPSLSIDVQVFLYNFSKLTVATSLLYGYLYPIRLSIICWSHSAHARSATRLLTTPLWHMVISTMKCAPCRGAAAACDTGAVSRHAAAATASSSVSARAQRGACSTGAAGDKHASRPRSRGHRAGGSPG
jgi:hypothetical protein